MAIIKFSDAASKVIGRSIQFFDYTVEEIPEIPNPNGGSRTALVSNGIEYDLVAGVDVGILEHASVTVNGVADPENIYIRSSDETIAKIEGNKIIAQGVFDSQYTDFYIGRKGYSERKFSRFFRPGGELAFLDTTGLVAGSLSRHVDDAVKAMIGSQVQSNSVQRYITASNWNIDNPTMTLNPDIFTGALDFSATSVMRSRGSDNSYTPDERYAPALVSNRHAIVAQHTYLQVGESVLFRLPNGSFQKVAVENVYQIADYIGGDIQLVYFDAEVDGSIVPYETMPLNWQAAYCPELYSPSVIHTSLPVIRKAMHSSIDNAWGGHILVNMYKRLATDETKFDIGRHTYNSSNDVPEEWGEGVVIGGDSGSPSFLLINNKLVLVGTQSSELSAGCIDHFTIEINTAMNEIANISDINKGSYALQHPVLTEFNNYS